MCFQFGAGCSSLLWENLNKLMYACVAIFRYRRILYSEKRDYAGMDTYTENGREQRNESSCWHDSAMKKTKRETKREMDGLRPKAGTAECGSPRRMPRTEHSRNQEFGPLTTPSGKRRRRRKKKYIIFKQMVVRTMRRYWNCTPLQWLSKYRSHSVISVISDSRPDSCHSSLARVTLNTIIGKVNKIDWQQRTPTYLQTLISHKLRM